MPTAKHFQCPFCASNVTAMDEDEVIMHVAMHKHDHHPDANVNEANIRKMTKNIEVPGPAARPRRSERGTSIDASAKVFAATS